MKLAELREGSLSPGTVHSWEVEAKSGWFLELEVEQQWVDIAIRLVAPDGTVRVEQDLSGIGGVEELAWIGDLEGTWRVELRTSEGVRPGAYTIQWMDAREPTPRDRAVIDAMRLSNQARENWGNRRYADAESLYTRALEIREAAVGAADPGIASILYRLAYCALVRRQLTEAESLCALSLEIREEALGPNHLQVAASLSGLGLVCRSQRRYDAAKPLYERALQIREGKYGPDHLLVASSLADLATLYRRQGSLEEAERIGRRVLGIQEHLLGSQHARVGSTLESLASVVKDQGRFKEAKPLYQRALETIQSSPNPNQLLLASISTNLGILCYRLGQHDEAEVSYRRALAIYEEKLGPNSQSGGNVLNNLAGLYVDQGRYTEAEPLYRRSLEISENVLSENHPNVAMGLNNLGNLHQLKGEYSEAVPLYERALEILQRSLGIDDVHVAMALNNLASLHQSLGRFQTAEPMFRRALEIYEKQYGSDHPDVASAMNNLANLLQNEGRYGDAEPLYRKALHIRQESLGQDHSDVAQSFNNLAIFYQDQGRFDESEQLYLEAVRIWEEALGSEHPSVAEGLNNLGNLYYDQERYGEAEPLYRRAMQIWKKTENEESASAAMVLSNLASLYVAQGKYGKAEALFKHALEIQEERMGPQSAQAAMNQVRLAELSLKRGGARLERALDWIDTAIPILDHSPGFPRSRIEAYTIKARLLKQMGELEGALENLTEALRSAEELRPGVGGGEEMRAVFFEEYRETFDRMVAWQMEAGDVSRAFEYSERRRARTLLDQLAAGRIDLRSNIPEEIRIPLMQREDAIKARLAETQLQITSLRSREDLPEEAKLVKLQQLDRTLMKASREYQGVHEEIKNASPLWRDLITSGGQPVALATVQRRLVPDQRLMLQYQIGEERSFLFLIPPWGEKPEALELEISPQIGQQFDLKPGPLTNKQLAEFLLGQGNQTGIIERMTQSTRGVVVESNRKAPPLEARLHALWKLLVPGELWSRLLRLEEVTVIPDAALHYLPFEALITRPESSKGSCGYWLDDGPAISYAASVTSLYNVTQRPASWPAGRGWEHSVLSLSDPLYDTEEVAESLRDASSSPHLENDLEGTEWTSLEQGERTRDGYTRVGGSLTRLPGTALETEAIHQAFAERQMDDVLVSLSRLEATESRLRGNLQNKAIIHLATHGVVGEKRGALFAALAMTPNIEAPAISEDDGFLQLYEIYDLELSACELAVLSACQTSVGPQIGGEGVFALSRGFLVAGTRRVVASLWKVDDESTAALMGVFFGEIADAAREVRPLDYPIALRNAKRAIRSQERWRSPYYWAPFVLTGKQ